VPETLFAVWLFENGNPGDIKVEFPIINGDRTINVSKFKFSIKERIENGIHRIRGLQNVAVIGPIGKILNMDIKSVPGIYDRFFG